MPELIAERLIRDIPDFPKPGIVFKDITPVLSDPAAMRQVIALMSNHARDLSPDVVVGIESRGFLFGMPVAMDLDLPFVPVRKLGKLPYETVAEEYSLEYGTNTVEMHSDSLRPGQRVLVVDDLLATGGTAAAAARLIGKLGGVIGGFSFLVELGFLPGRELLGGFDVHALMRFE